MKLCSICYHEVLKTKRILQKCCWNFENFDKNIKRQFRTLLRSKVSKVHCTSTKIATCPYLHLFKIHDKFQLQVYNCFWKSLRTKTILWKITKSAIFQTGSDVWLCLFVFLGPLENISLIGRRQISQIWWQNYLKYIIRLVKVSAMCTIFACNISM